MRKRIREDWCDSMKLSRMLDTNLDIPKDVPSNYSKMEGEVNEKETLNSSIEETNVAGKACELEKEDSMNMRDQTKTSDVVKSNVESETNATGTKDCENVEKPHYVQQSSSEQVSENCVKEGTKVVNKIGTSAKSYADVTAKNKVNNEAKLVTIPTDALASRIGKPMIMDSVTAAMCKMGTGRVGFSRVLVEVSAKKVLPEVIDVVYKNGANDVVCRKAIKVEYDWVPPRCSECCVYGHTDQQCNKKKECAKPDCSTKSGNNEESKSSNSNIGGDDKGFIAVGNSKNGGNGDKVRKQNNQFPKQGNHKQVSNKNKQPNQFVYQQKKPVAQNVHGGSSGNGINVGKKDSIPSPAKNQSSPKKTWSVPGEIVEAMKKSANKYSILEMYDVNELGELNDIRNKEIVDEFISQNKCLSDNELQKWNFDMVAYYKQKVKLMEDKGNKQPNSCGNEVNDVYEDESGVAQCMEGDVVKGLDGGILGDQ
ncbi:ATPase, F1/V1/A1 complex, alpha/beta subunit, Zinc knuckle CX2CX4HX4C [Artemisia annua]|uniref:ATPase, F1/V1/A1 complex, alpha/beta subunit, Zinc knuckle CX2CX4HX4C n=1 Tax=Artemisia annua TaxID=35608 RepID=A0A2U1Q3J8_ARTAN|nr:ATPase, F1/V1/A1 complex, alpha/beta subunit, Zinc knuckle CX2CX4HX4C [Artemisia annua]